MKKIRELTTNRFLLLLIFTIVFIFGSYFATGNLLPTTDSKDLWFYSGLFMVLFSILFIEPYYTSPKNVITNTIPLILVFLSIEQDFEQKNIWLISFSFIFILLILSIIPLALNDSNKSPLHWRNKVSDLLKKIVVVVGKGKFIYSAVFLLFLYINITAQTEEGFKQIFDTYFVFLLILWGLVLAIDPKELHNNFGFKKDMVDKSVIGEIFGVQSRKIFLVKLFEDRVNTRKFDVVKFRYSMQDENKLISGIVFDTYLLNQEKWAKVLQLGSIPINDYRQDKNIVCKVTNETEKEDLYKKLRVDDFVGVVIRGSDIGKIKFEYSKKQDNIQEGDLLELNINGKRLFYQVYNGQTEIESLEAKNTTGFVEGEAIQLGEWEESSMCFRKFGWVPSINTPIFVANTKNITEPTIVRPDYKIGVIPNTTLPSIINLNDAISHHLALIGVTGSGKSFIARELIKELLTDTKVICVDFTGEWKKSIELSKVETEVLNKSNIDTFLNSSDSKVGIVELPTLSNTSDVLKATENLFEVIFNYARSSYDQGKPVKIALVLEEAHTITPETSFLGDMGDYGSNKALVNKMGQVALQGRKYGVGLLVIAQRTANVSKTVLTQCNTVICFQAFDETSFNFLGNYVGKDLVQTLPNLKQFHAIVTGKAVRSNIPMIIDLTRSES